MLWNWRYGRGQRDTWQGMNKKWLEGYSRGMVDTWMDLIYCSLLNLN